MNIFDVLYARNTGRMNPRAKITDNLLGLALAGGAYEEKTIDFTPIISVSDAKAGAVLDYQCKITAKQTGTGDPSPTNIRPIDGWVGAQIKRRNKNLLLASDFLADIVASTTGATVSGTKITLPNGSGNVKADTNDRARIMEGDFKENTRYSIFVKQDDSTQATRGLFTVHYTDGTNQPMYSTAYDSTGKYWKITTPANKTVKMLRMNRDSTDPICYDTEKSGIFEGNVSYDDFVKSEGEDITLSFGTTIYNAQGDVTTGTLTVDYEFRTILSSDLVASDRNYSSVRLGDLGYINRDKLALCNMLVQWTGAAASIPYDNFMVMNSNGYNRAQANILFDGCKGSTPAETLALNKEYLEALEANGDYLTLCFALSEPITYNLTPTEITLAEGANTIWADCGDSKLTYLAKK